VVNHLLKIGRKHEPGSGYVYSIEKVRFGPPGSAQENGEVPQIVLTQTKEIGS